MLESTNHASTGSIYGGNAETGLRASVVGQYVDEARAWQGSGLPLPQPAFCGAFFGAVNRLG